LERKTPNGRDEKVKVLKREGFKRGGAWRTQQGKEPYPDQTGGERPRVGQPLSGFEKEEGGEGKEKP